jgi:hypothetical protein
MNGLRCALPVLALLPVAFGGCMRSEEHRPSAPPAESTAAPSDENVAAPRPEKADAPAAGNLAAEKQARQAARAWLALVDAGDYAGSWDAAAGYFRAAITKDPWQRSLAAARTPLGRLVSREFTSAQYATSLPGAPDGEYVVIRFATAFENKAASVETVTPMMDKDGKWRVSGYYIR